MRVVSQDFWQLQLVQLVLVICYPSNAQDVPWFGATEDYSIVLNSPIINASFLWDNAQTTSSIDNLSPGTYTVTITPTNGCAVQDSATI